MRAADLIMDFTARVGEEWNAAYSMYGRMTVGDLITQLQAFDPATLVLVNGYEGGYQPPDVYTTRVADKDRGSYCGPWSDSEDGEPAVIVSRGLGER